jgi:hypothetical protein
MDARTKLADAWPLFGLRLRTEHLGVARVTQKFRMTAEGWHSRPRPPLAVEGLDGIRDMFGAASAERA